MPKARSKTTATKKGKKVPLTRGRTKKKPVSASESESDGEVAHRPEDEDQQSEGVPSVSSAVSVSASEREEEQDHRDRRGGKGKETGKEKSTPGATSTSAASAATTTSEAQASKKKTKVKKVAKSSAKAKAKPTETEEEVEETDKPVPEEVEVFKHLKEVPNLVAELRGNRGTSITYVTKDVRHRQFELRARKALLQSYNDLDMIQESLDTSLNITSRMCPDSKLGSVAEAIKTLGFPSNFSDLVLKLMVLPKPSQASTYSRMHETLFEESEDDLNLENDDSAPFSSKTPKRTFPSPSKIAKFSTPVHNQGVYQFGGEPLRSGILSTNKAPRPLKPGEMVFSEGGSPIIPRRIQDDTLSKPMERIALIQQDGSKLEIDMVYRGAQDSNRLQGFKEFAKDVRTIAASRSTVKQNRLQPPRIPTKGVTQSASKAKPIWH